MTRNKSKIINTWVDPQMSGILNSYAQLMDVSRADIVRQAIREFIKNHALVAVDELPHPVDAQPVPVVYVERGE